MSSLWNVEHHLIKNIPLLNNLLNDDQQAELLSETRALHKGNAHRTQKLFITKTKKVKPWRSYVQLDYLRQGVISSYEHLRPTMPNGGNARFCKGQSHRTHTSFP